MAVVCALLHERFKAGEAPLAVVSMDNCSHNGEKLRNSILTMAEEWNKKGTLPTQRELARKYGRDEASISRTVRTFLEKLKREIEQER